MSTSARYFDLVREMKNAYNHRLPLVESAKQLGIKPTARPFATTVPNVRKWRAAFSSTAPRVCLPFPALVRNLSNSAKLFPPSVHAVLFVSSICRSAIALSSVSGGSMARWKNAAGNISASRTSRTSKLFGRCSSRSAPIPRISRNEGADAVEILAASLARF